MGFGLRPGRQRLERVIMTSVTDRVHSQGETGELLFVSALPPIQPFSFRGLYASRHALRRYYARRGSTRRDRAALIRLSRAAGVDPKALIALFSLLA